MNRTLFRVTAVATAVAMTTAACGSANPDGGAGPSSSATAPPPPTIPVAPGDLDAFATALDGHPCDAALVEPMTEMYRYRYSDHGHAAPADWADVTVDAAETQVEGLPACAFSTARDPGNVLTIATVPAAKNPLTDPRAPSPAGLVTIPPGERVGHDAVSAAAETFAARDGAGYDTGTAYGFSARNTASLDPGTPRMIEVHPSENSGPGGGATVYVKAPSWHMMVGGHVTASDRTAMPGILALQRWSTGDALETEPRHALTAMTANFALWIRGALDVNRFER